MSQAENPDTPNPSRRAVLAGISIAAASVAAVDKLAAAVAGERRIEETTMSRTPTFQITSFEPPIDGNVTYHGTAESKDGQRYRWATSRERDCAWCFHEDENGHWLREKAPAGLALAVRTAFRAAGL
jgi:hypothetical protein